MSGQLIVVIVTACAIGLVLAKAFVFRASKPTKPGPDNNWSNENYLNVESQGKSHANKHAGAGGIWSGGEH